jgi:putative transposase
MCKVLEVSRSGYYKWLSSVGQRKQRRKKLAERIQYHYADNHGLYGSPKITHLLHREGFKVTQKTVGRIMREQGLRARTVKKFRVQTTNSNHMFPIAPNLLDQDFNVARPNRVWVSDITYIRTRQGMMYLASVMDLCTRKIVGWSLADRMTVDLVKDALDKAYAQKKPQPGLIHHSDRGSQYASLEYREKLKNYGMVASMSRKGNCYDNACIESFHSILKREMIYLEKPKTKTEARQQIYWFIEFWYNRKRIHSHLNYLSPDRFESQYYKLKTAS